MREEYSVRVTRASIKHIGMLRASGQFHKDRWIFATTGSRAIPILMLYTVAAAAALYVCQRSRMFGRVPHVDVAPHFSIGVRVRLCSTCIYSWFIYSVKFNAFFFFDDLTSKSISSSGARNAINLKASDMADGVTTKTKKKKKLVVEESGFIPKIPSRGKWETRRGEK